MRLERSNPVTCSLGLRSFSMRTMSLRTAGVAVAVSAIVDGRPKLLAHFGQTHVFGAEIVSPEAEAVGLIHHQ